MTSNKTSNEEKSVVADLEFMAVKSSSPSFDPNSNELYIDGWVGLKSHNQPNETFPANFMDQLMRQGLSKKMFSIFIANETDRSQYSSILFGGSQDSGFQIPETATEFEIYNNQDDYSAHLVQYAIGDKAPVSQTDREAIFDPAYPFIYLPRDEFTAFANHMKTVFPTKPWRDNVCVEKYGTCAIPKDCTTLREQFAKEGQDFSLSFTLKGTNGTNMTIALPW